MSQGGNPQPDPNLGPIKATRKSGSEGLTDGGRELGPTLLDYWRWSFSNLISNTERGRLAEFIVASALGIPTHSAQPGWAGWDLTLDDPAVRIEVKTSAYLQEWTQKQFSTPKWDTPKAYAWNSRTGDWEKGGQRRHSDVYVFALHAHKEKDTIDPLDVSQWRFFVVPTREIDKRDSKSISIGPLRRLAREVRHSDLPDAVRQAAQSRLEPTE
jgi:hypothetical protein